MKNTSRYINIFILWVAGLIIVSHAIIPHAHHYDNSHSHQAKGCESSSILANQTEDTEEHCHSFNDLVLRNKNISSYKTSNSKPFPTIISQANIEISGFSLIGNKVKFLSQAVHPIFFVFLKNSPTRGSPIV